MRLWHIILIHDRGTSILLGRPLAVRPEDSDVPMPVRKPRVTPKKRKHDDDNFSEHFELSHPISDILADIINTLYSPQKSGGESSMRGQALLSNAKRIIRRMSDFRDSMPERYAWFFKGGPLSRADVASSPEAKSITEDEGLTLLKLGIARILLLRAVFSSRELGYPERRLALEDGEAHVTFSIPWWLTPGFQPSSPLTTSSSCTMVLFTSVILDFSLRRFHCTLRLWSFYTAT